jgi:hypothetical protein
MSYRCVRSIFIFSQQQRVQQDFYWAICFDRQQTQNHRNSDYATSDSDDNKAVSVNSDTSNGVFDSVVTLVPRWINTTAGLQVQK